MRFTVIWSLIAEDQLAELWLNAADRNAVSAAQHQIDQLLRIDPDTQGSPYFGDRVLIVSPLRAVFSINVMDMQVVVEMVW
jgi:plasmid stabilization system protein ParE